MDKEKNYEHESGITVKELIDKLRHVDPSAWVCFGPHGYFTYCDFEAFDNKCHIEFYENEGEEYELTDKHPYRKYLRSIGIGR